MARADELQDLLMDLQHDLGKYLRMPLSFLPPDASDDDVRSALRKAIRETKQGAKTLGARDLWQRFAGEADASLKARAGYSALERAVEQALKWDALVDGNGPVDRKSAEKDLGAVGAAIRALMQDLEDAA